MADLKSFKIRQNLYPRTRQAVSAVGSVNGFIKNKEKIAEKISEYGAGMSKSYRQEIFRKIIHLSSLWIPMLIYFAPSLVSQLVLFAFLTGDVLIEYGNFRRRKWARVSFGILFGKSLRGIERNHLHFAPSGGVYVFSAALICSLFFAKPVSVIALTVMLVSDTMAALVGKAFGGRKIYKCKSLEGTCAFFFSALVVNMLFEPIYHFTYVSVLACIVATVVELYESRLELDDNLAIPLSIGIVLTLFG